MRMEELKIDVDGKLEIDIMELTGDRVIILSRSKAKVAETKIITHQGQVKRVKWDEGEEF